MKSLLDIQQEIRELEKSVIGISNAIKAISADIDVLRDTDKDKEINYDIIERLSKQIQFGNHPLKKTENGYLCKLYIEMLLNIIRINPDSESEASRFIFIQWIWNEANIDVSLKDIFKECYKMETDSYHEFADMLPSKLKEPFITDAMIAANICGTADTQTFEYIAEMCDMLGIKKDRVRILSMIARIVLCQNAKSISREEFETVSTAAKNYKYYISPEILDISLQRKIAVSLPDLNTYDFKWKVKQYDKVKKGDIIASYQKSKWTNKSSVTIKAPCSGTVFIFRNNNTNYAVISSERDNKDSIKAWVKKKG